MKLFPQQMSGSAGLPTKLSAVALATIFLLSGCGGSSSSESEVAAPIEESPSQDNSSEENVIEESGELLLVLRDDEDDFLSYDVAVSSIELLRADGTQVSVISESARIDFIEYAEISELFAKNTVPAGEYTGVSFNLDYSDALIVVQDELGVSSQATVQDADGQPITELTMDLVFADDESLVISGKATSTLTIDLDLSSSNQILSFDPAIVQVEPFVNVTLSEEGEREHRARGLLSSVDTDTSTVNIQVKPLRKQQGDFGEFSFVVNDTTLFEVDGEAVENADGLATLAGLPVDSPIVAYGLVGEEGVFTASQVDAGGSVAWSGQDIFRGVISERDVDTVTINGVVLAPENKKAAMSRSFILSTSDLTSILGQNDTELTEASLTVGQNIQALGQFDDDVTFDAGEGIVHIKLSELIGQVVSADPLVVDLAKLNRRPIDTFDFSGTGSVVDNDADPDNYQLDNQGLALDDLAAEDWLVAKGYVNDYATAPMDFVASTLIKKDAETAIGVFKTSTNNGLTSPVVDLDNSVFSWDTTDIRQSFKIKGLPNVFGEEDVINQITADAEGRFAIKLSQQQIQYYAAYGDFLVALDDYLTQGALVKMIHAKGVYEADNQGLNASSVSVNLVL